MTRVVLEALTVIAGVVAAVVLAVSFAVDTAWLEAGWVSRLPACSARLAGGACVLCGMSHAFVEISRGDFAAAVVHNRLSPGLYALFLVLALAAAALLARRAGKKWNRGAGGGGGKHDPLRQAERHQEDAYQRAHS